MIDATGRLVEKTEKTKENYKKIYLSLLRRSGAAAFGDEHSILAAVVEWWQSQGGAWRPATIRQYRASIRAAAESVWGAPDRVPPTITASLAVPPAPRPRSEPRRTSARKRKSVADADLTKIAAAALKAQDNSGRLLAGLVLFGRSLGLRPVEWPRARVVNDVLKIRSAKTTNGRGIEIREISLVDLSPVLYEKLRQFLEILRVEVRLTGWRRLYRRLVKRLYRICRKLKIKTISLYTVRHQCLANAKISLDRVDVAALAGHVSARTAAAHYGRRRSGWRDVLVLRPTPATRAAVRVQTTPTPVFRSEPRPAP